MKKTTVLNLLLAFAAITVLGVVAVSFLGDGGTPESVPADSDAVALAPRSTVDEPDSLDPLGPDPDEPDSTDRFLETMREEAEAPEEPLGELVVQVWDGEEGVPAANADVFILEGYDGPEFNDPFAQHWSVVAETHGRSFKTDLNGQAQLPPVSTWGVVSATLPGAYGFSKIGRSEDDVVTITLLPDETVTVKVVDGANKVVAGVPVGILQHIPNQEDDDTLKKLGQYLEVVQEYILKNPPDRDAAIARMEAARQKHGRLSASIQGASQQGRDYAIGVEDSLKTKRMTDANGIAVFRHFQLYRQRPKGWWPDSHVSQFSAVLLVPAKEDVTQPFAGEPASEEIIELRIPPTGSIALRTVDVDGRPFTHPVIAELLAQNPGAAGWTQMETRKGQNSWAIEFPHVGLGLQFMGSARLDDDDFQWDLPLIAGPTAPDEQMIVDLLIAPGEGMLHGRLLDEAGMPLAGARPTFLINSSAGRLEGEEIILDPEGRFHLPYKVNERHVGPFQFEIRRQEVYPPTGFMTALGSLPTGLVTDLGDIPLSKMAPLAYGEVRDDLGSPIEGASVKLQRERATDPNKPDLRFTDEAFRVARTDADGKYELYGYLEEGRYRLRAEARDHFREDTADIRQGQALDITLLRKSRLVGTVMTPDWMPSRGLRVQLTSVLDPDSKRNDRIRDYEGEKYIYFDWVRAGTYDLEIRTQGFPDPIVRVEQLEVLPGQTGVHPRLEGLDLGAYLFRFEVTAVNESGAKIEPDRPLLARIVRPTGEQAFIGFKWNRGQAEIFSAGSYLDVWPLASGYHAEPTSLSQGESHLRFLTMPPVELSFPGMSDLLGEIPAWIVLTPADESQLPRSLETWDDDSKGMARWYGGRGRVSYERLGSDDRVQVELMRSSGVYQVSAAVGRRPRRTVQFDPIQVNLVPGGSPQRIVIDYDRETVQATVNELSTE